MGKTLAEIAQQLKKGTKKVQLIYAFNGTGKTRLSKEFKKLVDFKNDLESENTELANKRIIYYNAFTEDLFYWDNDLENNTNLKPQILLLNGYLMIKDKIKMLLHIFKIILIKR